MVLGFTEKKYENEAHLATLDLVEHVMVICQRPDFHHSTIRSFFDIWLIVSIAEEACEAFRPPGIVS